MAPGTVKRAIVACIANDRTDRCEEGFSTIFFQSAMDTSRLQGLNTSSISQQETCYDFAVDLMYSQKKKQKPVLTSLSTADGM